MSKSGIGVLKDSSGSFVHCDSKKGELMNEHFPSVFTTDNNSILSIECRTTSELNDTDFTADMITQRLKKLKYSSSAGPDGLRASFL